LDHLQAVNLEQGVETVDEALRALGVSASGAFDEFDAAGFGKRRHTDDWLE